MKKEKAQKIKRCTICVLPENFQGIRFNENGVCNHCQNFQGMNNIETKKAKFTKKFDSLIKHCKGKSNYDALMSYSGGKDSTYALSLMKREYGLNILALTFDNGFLPERTFQNIRNVTGELNIDHIFFKPRFNTLKKIFSACAEKNIFSSVTLNRASSICTACMAIVKFYSLRTALEKKIPFVIFGWSPGQIPITASVMKNNPEIIKKMQKSLYEPMYELVGDEIIPYFLEDRHFKNIRFFPHYISPLAFRLYDEEQIFEEIEKLGWKLPKAIDTNTTNCLLNSYATVAHKMQHKFNPYVFEISKLIREGYITRLFGLEKLSGQENPRTVAYVRKKLGI